MPVAASQTASASGTPGGRGRPNLAPEWALTAAGRYADSKVDFDGYPAPLYAFADTGGIPDDRQGSGRIGLDHAGSSVSLRAGLPALSSTRRDYYDPAGGSAPNYQTVGAGSRGSCWTGRPWQRCQPRFRRGQRMDALFQQL